MGNEKSYAELSGIQCGLAYGDKSMPRVVESWYKIENGINSLTNEEITAVYRLSPVDAIKTGIIVATRGIVAIIENIIKRK